jgi:hypothetical protein
MLQPAAIAHGPAGEVDGLGHRENVNGATQKIFPHFPASKRARPVNHYSTMRGRKRATKPETANVLTRYIINYLISRNLNLIRLNKNDELNTTPTGRRERPARRR